MPRSHLAAYAVAAIVIAFLGARWAHSAGVRAAAPSVGSTAPSRSSTGAVRVQPAAPAGPAIVHVAGKVRRPGVYRLPASARVQDAVRRAGGATRGADLDGLNLAARVEDGRQIVVPPKAPQATATAPPGSAPADGAAAGPPVNLNTATPEQLGTLDGVGPATARKILAYRQQHGGFGSVDELDQVPGIGPKRLAALRERVTT